MHFSSLLLFAPLLPSLVTAEQIPFMGKANEWLDKAKSFLPNSGPVEAGAAYIAERRVERINIRNWQRKLSPKLDTEEEWLVYVTGGNKSCFGRCGHADATWNVSLAECAYRYSQYLSNQSISVSFPFLCLPQSKPRRPNLCIWLFSIVTRMRLCVLRGEPHSRRSIISVYPRKPSHNQRPLSMSCHSTCLRSPLPISCPSHRPASHATSTSRNTKAQYTRLTAGWPNLIFWCPLGMSCGDLAVHPAG